MNFSIGPAFGARPLVRRLIEKITVLAYKFTVKLKPGVTVAVEGEY